MDATRLEKCRQRLYCNWPLIGGWLRRRAARALAQDGSPGAVQVLAEAVTESTDQRVRALALEALGRLAYPAAVDAFCGVWAATRDPALTTLLLRNHWVAQVPAAVRVLCALKVGRLEAIADLHAEGVEPLLQACEDRDPDIAQQAAAALRQLQKVDAQEAVCRHVVATGHPLAHAAALESNYLPRDEHERALFLFLTKQWERYEALDFDRRLLHAAYESADAALRRRIAEKLRAAGRPDYLTVLAGSDYRSRAGLLTPDEAEVLVHQLIAHREWAKLWALAFELALRWSVQIIRTLAHGDWRPQKEDERTTFDRLAELASGELALSDEEMSRDWPPAVRRAHARVSGRINDLAFSPRRPLLAVGTGRRKVVLWNFQRGEREQVLDGFEHSVGRVAFSHDDALLCAERPGGGGPCALHGWRDGRRFALRHSGTVTAVEPVGDSQALVTQRDQRVILLDTATARTIREESFPFWARAARVSPDGKQAALLHHGVALVTLPGLELLAGRQRQSGGRVSTCAAFAPSDEALIVGQSSGEVAVCRQHGKQLRAEKKVLVRHGGPVQGVEVLGRGALVLTAGADRTVHFTSWADRTALGRITVTGERLTSLHVSPGGDFLALGGSDASLSLWDLRVLDLPLLFSRPFARTMPRQLAAIGILVGDPAQSAPIHRSLEYLECALRHRFRYDVEIGEMLSIRTGEFDIEIEG